ncbi:glycosyltransferase [Microbacterium indicum]|uniref:glycosyltransferase n=1 Tax=Microbacterium indicum TaxID=358100 RepID=UPI0004097877|nr:glycosyltransferase family 2 protein [Microbacterium indicum]
MRSGEQPAVDVTVVVPTFNERGNVAELVRRAAAALAGRRAEILFVDDSNDGTDDEIARVASDAPIPVRMIHRDRPTAGLGGAVVEGFRAARSDVCVVMDGDLQHPPEKIPEIVDRLAEGDVDIVPGSRYVGGGSATGLADASRHLVSRASTLVTHAMFPVRLRQVTDPMTGFFGVDRTRIDLATLKPRGFKILLEILVRSPLRVAEVPFEFADRFAGASKASFRQGLHFIQQLALLRFGKMSGFALIGALGAVANVAIVWLLTEAHVEYIVAAVIAAEVTIVANFLAAEHWVFRDMRENARGFWRRFVSSFVFNNVESAIRIPIMVLLVERLGMSSAVATAITLAVAFLVRFTFHSLVVYAPRKERARSAAEQDQPARDRAV